jgi:hypothetical protein
LWSRELFRVYARNTQQGLCAAGVGCRLDARWLETKRAKIAFRFYGVASSAARTWAVLLVRMPTIREVRRAGHEGGRYRFFDGDMARG